LLAYRFIGMFWQGDIILYTGRRYLPGLDLSDQHSTGSLFEGQGEKNNGF
jgi:hypothetical protein